MSWQLVKRFEKGKSEAPLLGIIASCKIDGHKTYLTISGDYLVAWVGGVGRFQTPFRDIMNGLEELVEVIT